MAKRIPALSYDDFTWEGSGSTLELAVAEAHLSRVLSLRETGSDLPRDSYLYDLFTRVEVREDGFLVFHAFLR